MKFKLKFKLKLVIDSYLSTNQRQGIYEFGFNACYRMCAVHN